MKIILAGACFILGFMAWAQLYGKHEQMRRDERVVAAVYQTTIQQDEKEQ